MSAEYRWVMTPVGLAKRAAAETGGALLTPAQLAVGDGNGAYHEPEGLTDLVHQVWIGALNRVYISPTDDTLVVVEALIPPDVGGWDIREASIVDADGDVIAIGKYPVTSKPAPGSGSEKQVYIRGGFRVSNGGDLIVAIGSSMVMATQEYVDEHAALTNPHSATSAATANRLLLRDGNGRAKVAAPTAGDDIARKDTVDTHSALTNPHSATSAATANLIILRDGNGRAKVAVPAAADDIARKDTIDNAIAGLINSAPGALDTLKELADAMGDDPNFAATVTNALAGKVSHSLATAVNDFLVASGAGVFVKKTLAEVKAIFGFGDAAYKNTGTAAGTVAAGDHVHSGALLQTKYASTNAIIAVDQAIPIDNTIPQITEGVAVLDSPVFTPKQIGSKLVITCIVPVGFSSRINGFQVALALFAGAGANAVAASVYCDGISSNTISIRQPTLRFSMTTASLAAITFHLRAGYATGGATGYINGNNGNAGLFGGLSIADMRIDEIAP